MVDIKALVLDIETRPLVSHTWSIWNVNIGINQIMDPGGVLCFAAKWLDGKKVMFHSDHHDGHEKMIGKAYELIDEADVLIHFNGARFDAPWLNREFIEAGMTPPAPVKQVDLMKVVKKHFRWPSNKLDFVAGQLGLGHKVTHAGHQLWVDCMRGDEAAWAKMKRYNTGDVKLTEALYFKLLPWITSHPSVRLLSGDDRVACPACGSERYHRRGTQVAVNTSFTRFQCQDCGSWFRSTKQVQSTAVRGVAQ